MVCQKAFVYLCEFSNVDVKKALEMLNQKKKRFTQLKSMEIVKVITKN